MTKQPTLTVDLRVTRTIYAEELEPQAARAELKRIDEVVRRHLLALRNELGGDYGMSYSYQHGWEGLVSDRREEVIT